MTNTLLRYFQSAVVIFFIAIPPWYALRKKLIINMPRIIIFLIFAGYLSITILLTQQFIPFILVLVTLYITSNREEFTEEAYMLRPVGNKLAEIITGGIAFRIFISLINGIFILIAAKFSIKLKEQNVSSLMSKSSWLIFIMISVLAIFIAPVVEEYVFRHMFYRSFRKRFSFWAAAVLSSLLFTVAHFNIAASISIFGVGIYNCYLYDKYGYRAAVINHSIFNSFAVFTELAIRLFNIKVI